MDEQRATLTAQVYPPIVGLEKNGLAIPFAFGCAVMILQFFVVRFFFAETKGVRLEHMERLLKIGDS